MKKSRSSARTTSRSRRICSTDGGRMSAGSTRGGETRAAGFEPDPLPANGLAQRPMQHHVDPMNRGGAQRPVVATSAAQQVRIDVVDVGSGQLGDRYVPEVREEMAAHQAAGLAHRRRRPGRRRCGHPPFQELTDRAGPQPAVGGIVHEFGQRGTSPLVRCRARFWWRRAAPGIRIEAEIDPQLPGHRAPCASIRPSSTPLPCPDPDGTGAMGK